MLSGNSPGGIKSEKDKVIELAINFCVPIYHQQYNDASEYSARGVSLRGWEKKVVF